MDQDERQPRASGPLSPQEMFEIIVESAVDFAIFTLDENGITTSWNIGAERLFGFSEEDIIGISADIVFTPEDRAARAPEHERAIAVADGRAADERWHLRKDGSRFWASGLLMPLKAPSAGFVKIARDRTPQHTADERLRLNEQQFRLLATSIPQLVFRTQPDGAQTWGSPQWINFTGLGFEESVGFGWLDAVHPEDRDATRNGWTAAMARGEYYMEHRIRRSSDGAYRWHQTRARPIDPLHPRSSEWVGTTTDIHDLKGLQDQQEVLMAELQHRTRNLLAVAQAIATQTLRNSENLDDFAREFESRLRALSRVQGMIARADHGDVDLETIVLAELNAHAGPNGAGGRVVVGGEKVMVSSGAAQALALALHELATNAVKYGAIKQPLARIIVTWNVDRQEDGRRLVLSWQEKGVRYPSEGRPTRTGYGTELITKALPYQLGATADLEFGPEGVECAISVPLKGHGDGG